jgi:hypothetical protein
MFLISQKIRIDTKYSVTDEQGRPLLYVVRPTYLVRSLLAIAGGMGAGGLVMAAFMAMSVGLRGSAGEAIAVGVGALLALTAFVATAVALSVKRHTTIYRDESMTETFVTIEQDAKFQPIIATYTVRDEQGQVLAHLRKNFLQNLIRRKFVMTAPDGREILEAQEDSWVKAALRRVLGPMLGLLRTNFILLADGTDEVGQFNRKMTLLDKYVLDLSGDRDRKIDRRLALALGVMLDTGEKR